MSDESRAIGKEPCPACGSRDNLARYNDGHGYCFGCGHYEHTDGTKDWIDPDRPPRRNKVAGLISNGEFKALGKRKINEETCRKFDYQVGEFKGRPVQIANYRTDGDVVAQKVRFPDKDFTFLGDTKKCGLFGQHLWRNGGKRLVITEGEIDALTVSQLQGNKWPVVSVPNGAQGAAKSIVKNLDFVESYAAVVLMFDMDEPGQAAAKECAALLSPGKAYIAHLPMKDPNECHVNGKGAAVISAMWDAKPWRPDGVVDVESLIEDAVKPLEHGKPWPWKTLTSLTYGRRRGELYGFGGGTGCGKSTIFKQVAKHVVEMDKLPVGLLMLEEAPKHTLKTVAGMFMGKRLHVPGVEYDRDEMLKTLNDLKGKVFFYNHFGTATFDTIKEKIRYMVRALGIKDIFLDHLTALAASIDTDERKAIDKIMAELSSLTQELDCTIYFISHLATPEGKPHEEGGRVFERHFRGSRSIAFWSHFLFAIERNKQDMEGVTTFRVLKDRFTGDANGLTFGLAYDKDTGLLNECPLPTTTESPFPRHDNNDEY